MDKEILENLKFLNSSKNKYEELAIKMLKADNGKIYPLDLFFLGITKRSLSIISGFTILIEKNNFLSATPLIRLHMDNLLQIYAMFLVDKPHEIATNLMRGRKRMKDYKDRCRHNMTDSYLSRQFFSDYQNEDFLELVNVYKETSKFIHFSDKHILSIASSIKGDSFKFVISEDQSEIPKEKIIESVLDVIKT